LARRAPLDTARGVAATVLHRVMVDAAFASRVLDTELARAELDERDARLATEIVYGTLRVLPELDRELDQHLTRGRPDPFCYAALRTATYQARFLSRVPDHAIVQETVALVKQKRGEGLGKLTNAVLRRVVAARPKDPQTPDRLLVPEWVDAALAAGLGDARAAASLRLDGQAPPLTLRVPHDRDLEALRARIAANHPEAQLAEGQLAPRALALRGVGDPRRLPGHEQGEFVVQDEGAQLIGLLCDAQPGERVLDACCGHGGKTLQLLEAVGASGHVTAVDLHQAKLDQLAKEARRMGHGAALEHGALALEAIDLSVGDGGLEGGFDRVLVDAPCTGLGTLRRRPELLLRLGPTDPARMAALQFSLLCRAVRLVRPGGILVFAVCSGTREEALAVAEKLEARVRAIRRRSQPIEGVALTPDEDGVFRIGPWLGREANWTDVYQVVRWDVLDSHPTPA
jgi:16S rRNA (cytosine967-C5)-methyltransferase